MSDSQSLINDDPLNDQVLRVLSGRVLRPGQILGELLNWNELITGGDVKRALENLEALGQIENVCGDCWRLAVSSSVKPSTRDQE